MPGLRDWWIMTEPYLPENFVEAYASRKAEEGIERINKIICGEIPSTPGTRADVVSYVNSWIDFLAMGDTDGLVYDIDCYGNIVPPDWPPAYYLGQDEEE